MNKLALIAPLAALVFATGADADTIPFIDVQFEATVIALTSDGVPGIDSMTGPLGSDIVSLSAASVGAIDAATAGAIVGQGLMTTSVDVSAGDVGSAVATSRFAGSFVNGAGVSLSVDFAVADFMTGSGGAATTLFVSLISDGATLYSNFVNGLWQFSYTPVAGTTSVLDLTLSSEASAAFLTAGPGNASGFGMVSIAGVVPEASTWLLFAIGLVAVAAAANGPGARRRLQRC